MIKITDEDIKKVEQKFGLEFDDESKAFIKCMESKDIQACPGAGKTTSLVAKLDILANSMPFSDNSGILVLTHTNVAVDEIKKKLGGNAKVILGYPNHVGTFQSFVNKFLAIPMYIKIFGKRPERIDDEVFENLFYNKLPNNIKYGLKQKFKKNAKNEQEEENNVKNFLKSFYIDNAGKLRKFNGKAFDYKDNPPSITYEELLQIKKDILESGILSFSDCYEFANQYLTKYPVVSTIFKKRFKYIFIDEVQDTDDRQFKILDILFKDSDVIIQKIGDNNQAIFAFAGQKEKGWNVTEDSIEIKNTKRLSSLIATQVEKIAIVKQELNGNEEIKIKPSIILFDDNSIKQIIPKFADLIIEHNLHNDINNPIFKAVGGVAKQNDKGHTIPRYFPPYKKEDNCFSQYDTLQEKLNNCIEGKLKLFKYRNMILEIVKEYLKKENIKYKDKFFTKHSILKYLKEESEISYNNFKLQVLQISKQLYLDNCVKNDLQDLIKIILDLYSKTLNVSVLDTIIKNYKMDFDRVSKNNIYTHTDGDIKFDIEIKTIHKAKGETHTATLVLDTYKDGYDVFQLLDYFKGINKRATKTIEAKKKLIYVATSRATHLLCLAIHKKHTHRRKVNEVTNEDIAFLKDNGFRIIEL